MSQPEPEEEILGAELVAALLGALEPQAPRDPARIMSRLMERVAVGDGFSVVRAAAGEWQSYAPGVDVKVLFDDGRMQTWLARLEREARLPGHDHPAPEECLMLEGTVYMGDVLMKAGDYIRAEAGTRHSGVYSPDGCLILVRSASPEAVT